MSAPEKTGLKGLARHRGYLTALVSNTVSRFGDSIDMIAYGWMVYQLTGSTLLMGSVFAVSGLPNLLFGFLAGVFVDRMPKKTVVVVSHALRAAGVGSVAALYGLGRLEPWMLFVFAFFNSTVEAFAHPANTGLTQRIVPKDAYLEANSLSQSASSIAELTGLGLAGAIIATIGIAGAIAVDAATFLVAALGISIIRVEDDLPATANGINAANGINGAMSRFLAELREGLAFVWDDKLIRLTVLLAVFANFALAPFSALQPAYVKDVLGAGPVGMSVIGMGFTVGMAAGGLALARFGGGVKRMRLILAGFFAIGILYAGFALPPLFGTVGLRLAAAGAVSFLTGASLPLVNSTIGAYLMERTPPALMGRTVAVLSVAATAAMPFGAALSGAAAELTPIPVIFMVLGILTVMITAFAVTRPAVRVDLSLSMEPEAA